MTKQQALKLFEEKKVRTVWDDEQEKWYFSIVDVVSILTESTDGRKYWNKLKQRLKEEGNETVTNCHQLKMQAVDGKMNLKINSKIIPSFRYSFSHTLPTIGNRTGECRFQKAGSACHRYSFPLATMLQSSAP